MPNTTGYGWPYPGLTDGPVDGPGAFESLAEAVEATVQGIDVSLGLLGRASFAAAGKYLGSLQTTATAYTDFAGNPSVTVTVGQSGIVIVIASMHLSAPVSADSGWAEGYAALNATGAKTIAHDILMEFQAQPPAGAIPYDVDLAQIRVLTAIPAGDITLKLLYASQDGVEDTFSNPAIIAIALP